MTAKHIMTDPASAMGEQARALAEERKLSIFLDRIVAQEKARNEASTNIQAIWVEVRRAGFNVEDARRKLIYHAG